MTMAGLIFEIGVAALLVVVALLSLRVDARLRALREGRDGVAQAVKALDDAVARAHASVAALTQSSQDAGAELAREVERARGLTDELRLMAPTGRGAGHQPAPRPRDRLAGLR